MAESDQQENPQASAPPEIDDPNETLPETGSTESESKPPETANDTDLGQKIVDIALGAVVLTGELTIQAARLIADHGPEFFDTLEAKGRPVREKIDDWFKSTFAQPFPSDVDGGEGSADEEISALERRVRELEQQVAQTQAEVPPPAPSVTPGVPDLDDGPVANANAVPPTSDAPSAAPEAATGPTDAVPPATEALPPTGDLPASDSGETL